MNILDGYLTRAALANQLSCSERTIWRYENLPDGLPSVMIGGRKLYPIDKVQDWIRNRETCPNPRRSA